MRLWVVLSCLLLMPAQVFAASNQDAEPLAEVIVTDEHFGQSLTVPDLEEARERLRQIPGGANIVDSETVKRARATTVQDLLGYSPGVFVQPRFGAEEARLSIRGSGLARTFHLRGIKLLQDGVPINQADGGADFQAIEPLATRYVEVYRGANALAYGSTTLGGAVNFVSPTGHDAALAQARLEAGNHGYLRSQMSSGYAMGPADYYLSVSHLAQDGFRAHSRQNNKRFFSNLGWRWSDSAETRLYVTALDTHSNLPGNLTKAQLESNPSQAASANITGNQKRDFDLVRLAGKTTIAWDNHQLESSVFWIYKDLFHPIFQVLDIVSDDMGFETRYRNQSDLMGHANTFTLGFAPVWGFVQDDRFQNSGGNRGSRTAETKQRSYNLDLYAEDQLYVLPAAALVGGLQMAYAVRKADDFFLANGDNSGRQIFHGLSPKVGARYDLTPKSQVFANFSRSFEPPSFGELTNVAAGGLLRLDPQRASTVEVGTRGQEALVQWDAVYYHAWVSDELLSLNDGSGNPLGTLNASQTRHQGIELGLGADLVRGLLEQKDAEQTDRVRIHGIYNWSYFTFDEDPVYTDNHLPGIPEHFIRLESLYEHPKGFYAGPNLEWSLVDYPVDLANSLHANRHALLGFKAGYRTKKGASVFVEAKNLTDERYAATTGVIADARGRDAAQFLPGDGRTWLCGMEWRW